MQGDGRKDLAKAIPILEVAAALPNVPPLRREGAEHVGGCPVCGDGGKRHPDRFSINPARGVWNCRKCARGGDGLELVQFALGCDFPAALDHLLGEGDVQVSPAELARRKAKSVAEAQRQAEYSARARDHAIADARRIWRSAETGEGTPVEDYLAGRGIRFAVWPPALRFLPDHPAIKRIARQNRVLHRGPCMIAGIQDRRGRVRAVHQTWIDPARPGRKAEIRLPDGSAAPAKMVRGSKKGGAIRLSPLGSGVLVMGEGIETTATVMAHGPWPSATYWAGVDLGNMAGRMLKESGKRYSARPDLSDQDAWIPPEGTRRLIFLQDGDSDPAATRAKLLTGLRRARAAIPGLEGVIVPAPEGMDFNDLVGP